MKGGKLAEVKWNAAHKRDQAEIESAYERKGRENTD